MTVSKEHQELVSLAKKQIELEKEIEELEALTKSKQKDLLTLSQETFPKTMENYDTTEIVVEGMRLRLSDGIHCNLPSKTGIAKAKAEDKKILLERKAKAFKWLKDNDHDGIIKNVIKVDFGKGEDENAEEFIKEVNKLFSGLTLSQEKTVHTQTLKSFVKECLEAGEEIPFKPFGIHEFKYVAIIEEG